MAQALWQKVAGEILASKRVRIALIGAIVALGAKVGLKLDPTTLAVMLAPIVAAILGISHREPGHSRDGERLSE